MEHGHYARKLTEEEIKRLEKDEPLSTFQQNKFEREVKKNWDLFYKRNSTHFFKDRHWITREFPELLQIISEIDCSHPVLLEVGCGVGNTLFPLLEENAALFVHACDFSPRAIDFLKVKILLSLVRWSALTVCSLQSHPSYRTDRCSVFVCDVTANTLCDSVGENSVDLALVIFVLSAISPEKMVAALKNIFQVYKPCA